MTRDPREEQDVSDVPETKASASAPSDPSDPVVAGEPSGNGERRIRDAARAGRAFAAARAGDPFPTAPEFAQRVRRAWMWTGVLLLGIVAGLLLSGFDANPGRLLANFRAHVFSVDAWPISVAQYLLLALAAACAARIGRLLVEEYERIDARLLTWAALGFDDAGLERDVTGPIGRIQFQLRRSIEAGITPSRDALLEEFDAEFERHYAPLRHLASIAIFFGLLGTFWGLQTHAADLAAASQDKLPAIAAAMNTAFACSIVGVLSALLAGFLSLRMHGLAVVLRQRLDHALTSYVLPAIGPDDVSAPIVEVLERLRDVIHGLGNMGASVQQLPELLREMRVLFTSWTSERVQTTSALAGLEASVRGLDALQSNFSAAGDRFARSTDQITPALQALSAFAETLERRTTALQTEFTGIGSQLGEAVKGVDALGRGAREDMLVLLQEHRAASAQELATIIDALRSSMQAIHERHEKTIAEIRDEARAAFERTLEAQRQEHLAELRRIAESAESHARELAEVRERLGGRRPRQTGGLLDRLGRLFRRK